MTDNENANQPGGPASSPVAPGARDSASTHQYASVGAPAYGSTSPDPARAASEWSTGYPASPSYSGGYASVPDAASPTGNGEGGFGASGYSYPTSQVPTTPTPTTTGPRRNGFGRSAALGLAAVVLAGASAVGGGLVVHQLESDNATPSPTQTVVQNAAPNVDRSSLASIAAAVQPSVVSIRTNSAEGSGVVLTADGNILTNNHVAETANGGQISVQFSNGKVANARIVGTDPKTDLAVLKAEGVSGLTPAKFGDSSAMRVGDSVLALGSPLGLDGSVTAGIISALNRTINEESGARIAGALQTDAAINPGNSGGALVNLNGEVIGINTAIAQTSQDGGNIGVGFAIPSNKAKSVADQLMNGQKVSHPYLGVQLGDAPNGGAVIGSVVSGSPADKAGLRAGDLVTKVNGTAVQDGDGLVAAVQAAEVGQTLQLTVERNGSEAQISVTLAESP
jgi:putative serine protease PepD